VGTGFGVRGGYGKASVALANKFSEWVLDVLEYDSVTNLLMVLDRALVRPALEKADQLERKKAESIQKRHVSDYQ
jgi:hypothetical protein